jgi:outer membrane protein
MRRTISTLAIMAFMFAATLHVSAQSKLAHLNVDELISLMPETQAAEAELQTYATQLQKEMEDMQKEAQTKYQNLMANQTNWTQLRVQKEQEELQSMGQKMEEFQMRAQQDLQNKQMELMKPIIQKAQDAVNAVAREQKFVYVLDSSASKGVVIFTENGENILPLVKAKLGIK